MPGRPALAKSPPCAAAPATMGLRDYQLKGYQRCRLMRLEHLLTPSNKPLQVEVQAVIMSSS